jgi:hypothetical protein
MKYLTKEQRDRLATAPKITQSLYAALDHADEAERLLVECAAALEKARYELNAIRARDGVPYTHMGWKASVDENYFSTVVDECGAVLAKLKVAGIPD